MSKPDWKDAPEWAEYLAMDSDGEWFWYEKYPSHGDAAWHAGNGKCQMAGYRQEWTDTLEQRP